MIFKNLFYAYAEVVTKMWSKVRGLEKRYNEVSGLYRDKKICRVGLLSRGGFQTLHILLSYALWLSVLNEGSSSNILLVYLNLWSLANIEHGTIKFNLKPLFRVKLFIFGLPYPSITFEQWKSFDRHVKQFDLNASKLSSRGVL